jgi:transposase InsO family protein
MKQEGLISKYVLKRKKNENKTNRDPIENKLDRDFGGYKANKVLVSDLTYVSIKNKWYYVCLIIELCHREIIGFAAGEKRDAELIKQAIYSIKCNLSEIDIFHTDRGGEFKNDDIDKIFKTFGIGRSLSRPGKPIDNAVAESMYDIFKTEFVYDEVFSDLENLQERLNDWVIWYNTKRLHGSLKMLTPSQSKEQNEIGVAKKPKPDYKKIAARKASKKCSLLMSKIDG